LSAWSLPSPFQPVEKLLSVVAVEEHPSDQAALGAGANSQPELAAAEPSGLNNQPS
jgi:hypothetical protein